MIVLSFAPSGSYAAVRPKLQRSKFCEDTGSVQSDKLAVVFGARQDGFSRYVNAAAAVYSTRASNFNQHVGTLRSYSAQSQLAAPQQSAVILVSRGDARPYLSHSQGAGCPKSTPL
jgi:hypothetical protein